MGHEIIETWQQWLESAGEDLRLAQTLLEEQHDFYPPICFHSQQAVEKALKAFLYFHRVDEEFRGHHLGVLLARCEAFDQSFQNFRTQIAILDQYYVPTRYPDALAGMTSSGVYHEGEAREAVNYTKEILAFVEELLNRKK